MQHVFSHQQQYPPDTWSSNLPHQPLPHSNPANPHATPFTRINNSNNAASSASTAVVGNTADTPNFTAVDGPTSASGAGPPSAEERRVLQWIAQLMDPATRESALLELSKKREQFPQLALILWHSFGEHTLRHTSLLLHAYAHNLRTGGQRHG